MGRRAQGYQVRWKNGAYRVRFSLEGTRAERDTGVRDRRAKAAADRAARTIWAQALREGKPRERRAVPLASGGLLEWVAAWLADLSVRPITRERYRVYSGRWISEFGTLAELASESRISQYVRQRLGEVRGKSARNELSALRQFLAWLVEAKAMSAAPVVQTVKTSVSGTPFSVRRRTRAPELSPAEVRRLIRALPERSTGDKWPIRARAEFAYETTLRPETINKLTAPANYSKGAKTLLVVDADDKEGYSRELPLSLRARRAIDSVCPAEGPIFGAHRLDPYLRAAAAKALPPQKAAIFCAQHFRSAALTHLLERSTNVAGVQYLAGHKHASTTARYVRPSFRAAAAVLAASR